MYFHMLYVILFWFVIFYVLFEGLQIWQDGSQYDGDFVNDKRHGEGEVKWSNNEVWLNMINYIELKKVVSQLN